MQVFGLPSDLASGLYRLETAVPRTLASATESIHSTDSTASIFHWFHNQVHQWYPILHSDFTSQFIESNAAGFPCSTTSCLSLLVGAIASLVDHRPHSAQYEAALSMMPIAIQEYSITSVQCLVLFSIYFSCLLQPRQAYDYIQAAFLKIQPFLKSEISMHFNLPCFGKGLRGRLTNIPMMPTRTYMWDLFGSSNTPSGSSLSGVPQNSEVNSVYSPNERLPTLVDFCTEINLQQELAGCSTSATDVWSTYDNDTPHERAATSSHAPGSSSETLSPDNGLGSQNVNGPICRAKYHMYEISIYWPVIYRIILDGIANTESLPYGSLFFQSVTGFLDAAKIALGVCLPKAWFLYASESYRSPVPSAAHRTTALGIP
ncbi:uncharacterized protein N7473_009733 [Penicillium subrubescens]|uniref:uncharacterized protein n=1 Tax=Penicillium subrubescens TaxID=1316194 RepID=UPI0025455ED5|nr:uncharacterized protein N7473_009733 [Penicillium subrubescens]KAJ5887059.1 hypothetical protein N7473_009733 [Penicillium subrubescens]